MISVICYTGIRVIQPQQAWQAPLSIAAGATKFILVKEATVYSRFDVVKLERHHLYRTKNHQFYLTKPESCFDISIILSMLLLIVDRLKFSIT